MNEEGVAQFNKVNLGSNGSIRKSLSGINNQEIKEGEAKKPSNQLQKGLLGWYAVCSSKELEKKELHVFTMYNEPLLIYKDKDFYLDNILI